MTPGLLSASNGDEPGVSSLDDDEGGGSGG